MKWTFVRFYSREKYWPIFRFVSIGAWESYRNAVKVSCSLAKAWLQLEESVVRSITRAPRSCLMVLTQIIQFSPLAQSKMLSKVTTKTYIVFFKNTYTHTKQLYKAQFGCLSIYVIIVFSSKEIELKLVVYGQMCLCVCDNLVITLQYFKCTFSKKTRILITFMFMYLFHSYISFLFLVLVTFGRIVPPCLFQCLLSPTCQMVGNPERWTGCPVNSRVLMTVAP